MKALFIFLGMFFLLVPPAIAGININTADLNTLQSLPGIGASRAKAIIDYRSIHGDFQSIEDLTRIRGISPELLEQIREMLEI
ncbi:MAG: ComEA family DNA-binding protein [Desulfobacteraceae bacterium]|nr:MAG: ComEA family DNA-binding protein [Desulfobacteraceae bacterium]